MTSAWLGAHAEDNSWSGFKHHEDTVVLLLPVSNYLRKLHTFGTSVSIFSPHAPLKQITISFKLQQKKNFRGGRIVQQDFVKIKNTLCFIQNIFHLKSL